VGSNPAVPIQEVAFPNENTVATQDLNLQSLESDGDWTVFRLALTSPEASLGAIRATLRARLQDSELFGEPPQLRE
jgi:hypothetical protein